jgi:hypothetical protein
MPRLFGLDPEVELSIGEYDFTKDGGAIGSITLRGSVIPKGALIRDVFIFTETPLAGAGATVALKAESTADLLAATAIAAFSQSSTQQGIPDWATVGDAVLTTDNRALTMTIAVAALTAGKFRVYVAWVAAK